MRKGKKLVKKKKKKKKLDGMSSASYNFEE
jgi:hypothetical protein